MKNEAIYAQYLNECDHILAEYKGKYLAVDDNYISIEGKSNYSRVVVITFKTEKDFNNWYYSDDYQRIVKYRLAGSECDSVLVHGK
jgi:uncharacterized protein (DUF1330 family)